MSQYLTFCHELESALLMARMIPEIFIINGYVSYVDLNEHPPKSAKYRHHMLTVGMGHIFEAE